MRVGVGERRRGGGGLGGGLCEGVGDALFVGVGGGCEVR